MNVALELPSGLSARPRTVADNPFLFELYKDSRSAELSAVQWPNSNALDEFCLHQFNAQELHFANYSDTLDYKLILNDAIPVGRLVIAWQPTNVHVADLIIHSKFQHQGIGTSIMGSLLALADDRGLSVTLYHHKANLAANEWYMGMGFAVVEELPMHIKMQRSSIS